MDATIEMSDSKESSMPSKVPKANVTEAVLGQTTYSAAVNPTSLPHDLDSDICRAAHQIQLIQFLTAHQRSIKYALHAVEEAIRGKQSNRLSREDVARKWLSTAKEEIDVWIERTKQMVEEVEDAGSSERHEKEGR